MLQVADLGELRHRLLLQRMTLRLELEQLEKNIHENARDQAEEGATEPRVRPRRTRPGNAFVPAGYG